MTGKGASFQHRLHRGKPLLSAWQPRRRAQGVEPGTHEDSQPDPNRPAHLRQPLEHLSIAPGAPRWGPGLTADLSPHGPLQCEVGAVPAAPHGQGPLRFRARGRRVGPQTACNPEGPRCPRLLKTVPRVARREQPGRRQPVLTKPTGAGAGEHGPAGPGAPAGDRGRRSGGGGTRRRRRRTPGVAANLATGFHSGAVCERRMRGPWGAPLLPPLLPAWEGKSVRSWGDPCVRVFPTAAGPLLGEEWGVRGKRVTPGSLNT